MHLLLLSAYSVYIAVVQADLCKSAYGQDFCYRLWWVRDMSEYRKKGKDGKKREDCGRSRVEVVSSNGM